MSETPPTNAFDTQPVVIPKQPAPRSTAFSDLLERLRHTQGGRFVPPPRGEETDPGHHRTAAPPDSYRRLYHAPPSAWGLAGGFVPPVPATPASPPAATAPRRHREPESPRCGGGRDAAPFRLFDD